MIGLVIPCYNEDRRLPIPEVKALLDGHPDVHLFLVNDGSTDRTDGLLRHLASTYPRVEVLTLGRNHGKAEAVRRGLNHLSKKDFAWIGYADADFATPAGELVRLCAMTASTPAHALLGSRVRLLGTDIERRAWRHYVGRVFATMASLALDLPVYDTQCGAKLFRNSAEVRGCVESAFQSRWAFDVELIGRLNLKLPHHAHQTFFEVPLRTWRDVGGSKLGLSAMIKAGLDVIKIGLSLRRRRASAATASTSTPR